MGVSVTWQVRVSGELDSKMQELADQMGLGKAELVRFISAQYLNQQTSAFNAIRESIDSAVSKISTDLENGYKEVKGEVTQ